VPIDWQSAACGHMGRCRGGASAGTDAAGTWASRPSGGAVVVPTLHRPPQSYWNRKNQGQRSRSSGLGRDRDKPVPRETCSALLHASTVTPPALAPLVAPLLLLCSLLCRRRSPRTAPSLAPPRCPAASFHSFYSVAHFARWRPLPRPPAGH
jgi:hypothetical protein